MRAIRTRFIGATAHRPARIKADDGCGHSETQPISYGGEVGMEGDHGAACRALCEKMEWFGELVGGHRPDGSMFWCWNNQKDKLRVKR